VFAGDRRYGGGSLAGGFPACTDHHRYALADGLGTFLKKPVPAGWEVYAYEVIPDEDDFPRMPDTPLWTARAGS
jgi:hypothetical protein